MKKLGLLFMFIGIVFIAIFTLTNIQIPFTAWLIGFLISLLVSVAGMVLLIIYLAKEIKEEKRRK
ncbi:hypothetical protein SAMN05880501_108115 [Ureibacillus xyleni]|uniref:Uncharacterized protein n=1 Tax=Ureibacillus xyleni TaxID=614648 RepID=A0A285T3S3_9BACL|nr:hypothetical protein [Ureibacillus xyleni]SOC15609.1 hypothetical protein SAMN05880501_108115 [Ureibacillus xyleni]